MKILITTGIYPPDIGGPATYSKLLFDQLPKRGIDVSVLSFGEVRKFPKIIRHIYFLSKVLLRASSADIIFAQDTTSVGFPSFLASKILSKKLFVRVPGDHAWEQASQRYGVKESIDDFQNKRYGWKIEFLRKVQKITLNGASTIITPSVYFRDLVSKWVRNKEKVFCIYNGIDLSALESSKDYYEPKTIISAGRLVPWKGFMGLISVMKHLPDWKLSIAGDGPLRKDLEEFAKKEKVEDRVNFLGQISREDLIKKIQSAEVFVLNTSFESFSFQIVESMAAGTPVITTDIGNLKEIIDDRKSGILLKPDDTEAIVTSINLLHNDHKFRSEIIVEAKNKSKSFSIENTLDKLVNFLKKT